MLNLVVHPEHGRGALLERERVVRAGKGHHDCQGGLLEKVG